MKIVSLCPSLTELCFALDRGDDLVGRTAFCVRPSDRVGAVEKVGGTKTPKLSRIVALCPDVVLMNEEENRAEDFAALQDAGLRCHTSYPKNPRDASEMVRDLGHVLDRPARAEEIASAIERALHAASTRAAAREAVRYAYLIWREPLMTIGPDTYIAGLLAAAGGINAFAETDQRYPAITASALRAADPDVVLLASEPFPFADRHVASLAAEVELPRDRFALVDGRLLSWHGASTAAGIAYAADILGDAGRDHP